MVFIFVFFWWVGGGVWEEGHLMIVYSSGPSSLLFYWQHFDKMRGPLLLLFWSTTSDPRPDKPWGQPKPPSQAGVQQEFQTCTPMGFEPWTFTGPRGVPKWTIPKSHHPWEILLTLSLGLEYFLNLGSHVVHSVCHTIQMHLCIRDGLFMRASHVLEGCKKLQRSSGCQGNRAFPNIKCPKGFLKTWMLKVSSNWRMHLLWSKTCLLPEHKEKQHYSMRWWVALLKSVEWMGFIEIGRKCQHQSIITLSSTSFLWIYVCDILFHSVNKFLFSLLSILSLWLF